MIEAWQMVIAHVEDEQPQAVAEIRSIWAACEKRVCFKQDSDHIRLLADDLDTGCVAAEKKDRWKTIHSVGRRLVRLGLELMQHGQEGGLRDVARS